MTLKLRMAAFVLRALRRSWRGKILVFVIIALSQTPAFSQFEILQTVFKRLSGGTVWFSRGLSPVNSTKHTPTRGGFSLLYGPFYWGGTDTVITDSESITAISMDSSGTAFGGTKYQRIKSESTVYTKVKEIGQGPRLSLSVGYEFSDSYHFSVQGQDFAAPIGGVYLALFVTYWSPGGFVRSGSVGLGGAFLSLSGIPGSVAGNDFTVSTEKVVAPEVYANFNLPLSLFLDASYQYLRFSAATYQTAAAIPANVKESLPRALDLSAVHLTFGVYFSTKGFL